MLTAAEIQLINSIVVLAWCYWNSQEIRKLKSSLREEIKYKEYYDLHNPK